MGEKNEESRALIARVIGQEPELTIDNHGIMSLHLGNVVMTAVSYAFWSDPRVFSHEDGALTVNRGGSSVTISASANMDKDLSGKGPLWL